MKLIDRYHEAANMHVFGVFKSGNLDCKRISNTKQTNFTMDFLLMNANKLFQLLMLKLDWQ